MKMDEDHTNSHFRMIEGGDTGMRRVKYRSLPVEFHSQLKTGQQWTVDFFYTTYDVAALAILLFAIQGEEQASGRSSTW